MFIQGKARRVGDNVNTDQMYPTRYTSIVEDSEMAKHCMEDYDPDLIKRMDPGDVLVAGVGFGCGSSREHAPKSVKAAGFSCVVAKGFSPYLLPQCDQYRSSNRNLYRSSRRLPGTG